MLLRSERGIGPRVVGTLVFFLCFSVGFSYETRVNCTFNPRTALWSPELRGGENVSINSESLRLTSRNRSGKTRVQREQVLFQVGYRVVERGGLVSSFGWRGGWFRRRKGSRWSGVGRWSRLLLSRARCPLWSLLLPPRNPRTGWLVDRGCTVLARTDSANGFGALGTCTPRSTPKRTAALQSRTARGDSCEGASWVSY